MVGNGWNQVDPQQPGFGSKKSNEFEVSRIIYNTYTINIPGPPQWGQLF